MSQKNILLKMWFDVAFNFSECNMIHMYNPKYEYWELIVLYTEH